MKRWVSLSGLLGWCVVAVGLAAAQEVPRPAAAAVPPSPSPPPPELFYRLPDIERVELSPSGRWLAMRTGLGGKRSALLVFDVQNWRIHAPVARFADIDVASFAWVNDDRLVYSVVDRLPEDGGAPLQAGLFVVERDGSNTMQLVSLANGVWRGGKRRPGGPLSASNGLLHRGDGRGDEIVVGEWQYDGGGELRTIVPRRLNVRTGELASRLDSLPDHVWHWVLDSDGQPRVAVSRRDGRETIHWRAPGSSAWVRLSEHSVTEPPYVPRFVDGAGQLYVSAVDPVRGEAQLRRFDFATGRPAATPLIETPGFDFAGAPIGLEADGRLHGLRVLTDGESTVWFEPAMQQLQDEVDRRLPGRINVLDCRACGSDRSRVVLVHSHSDRDPGQLYLLRPGDEAPRRIGALRGGIDERQMASTRLVRVAARDGLEIPVWISLPLAATPAGKRPAVVLVHGGPWVRGRTLAWDADAQFLASRGYVVIEPEFRGSTGFGQRLFRAGWRQWGRAMQTDLIDALDWAIANEQVDPQRVCVAGGSYGGYATLVALAQAPDRFRCGAAWAAVTDPRLMFGWRHGRDIHSELRSHTLPELIGDPKADDGWWSEITPLAQAARIRAPLLLAHGREDQRVPIVHGERMRDALRKVGNAPDPWVVYDDEGHGWFRLETRIDFARRLEAFLGRHLAPREPSK
jgi:dienelactone hydrolase